MAYDQFTRDLAHKAGDDAVAAVHRTMALHPDMDGKIMIAIMAAGQATAVASGLLAAKIGLEPEAVAEALWLRLRPAVLKSTAELGKARA